MQPDNVDPAAEAPEETKDAAEETGVSRDQHSREANGATERIASKAGAGPDEKKESPGSAPLPAGGTPPPKPLGAAGSWPMIDCSKSHQEVESALYECMKTKYGRELVTDMDDSQLLLSYFTRNGLAEDRKIHDDVVKTLIISRERLRTGVFDSQTEEAKFRTAYGLIAKAAQPVTVASLRDSTATASRMSLKWDWERRRPYVAPESRPVPEIACLRYRNWAFFTLVALVLIQSYWTATSSILSKTDALIAETARARSDLAQQASRSGPAKTGGSSESAATSPTPANTPVEPPASNSDAEKTQAALEDLVSKASELEANYSMLATLMWPFKWLESKPEELGGTTSDAGRTPESPKTAPGAQPSPAPDVTAKENKDSDSLFGPNEFQTRRASTRAIAGQVIDVMQKWLLPLLYGALGAMVFVVRTLSMQARDRLFRREGLVSLVLRVFLGMISGLAIGWFWGHDSGPTKTGGAMTLSTLSPFALAFIAGYGVELFFALLDKIVSTFTNKA